MNRWSPCSYINNIICTGNNYSGLKYASKTASNTFQTLVLWVERFKYCTWEKAVKVQFGGKHSTYASYQRLRCMNIVKKLFDEWVNIYNNCFMLCLWFTPQSLKARYKFPVLVIPQALTSLLIWIYAQRCQAEFIFWSWTCMWQY